MKDRRRKRQAVLLLVHVTWIGLLSVAVTYRVGRFGFSPTDQGFILGTSWRLLHGEIPHRDIISARPLGSPLLHTLDFALPGPLFLISNLVSMVEIVLMTVALAALVIRRSLLQWGPLLVGLVAAASLINLHTHGLTAWHTVDGLTLTACGLWAVDAGLRARRTWHYRFGLVLLGTAALTKQSFMLAVPIGLTLVVLHPAARRRLSEIGKRWTHQLVDVLFLTAPGLLYLVVVAFAGGLPELISQLTGAEPAYGLRIVALWGTTSATLLLMLAGAASLVVVRLLGPRIGAPARIAEIGIVLAFILLVLHVLVTGELSRAGDWGIELFWLLVMACVVDVSVRRRLPWRAMLVVLLAWMCSLSWGYDSPTFLGGTLALTALYLLACGTLRRLGSRPARRGGRVRSTVAQSVLGGTAVLLAAILLIDSHDASPYRDRPQSQLVAHLGDIDPSLWGIRTNVDTYAYIQQIHDCTARYPATKTAVLPDNAFAYPAFGLRNPFPMDWPRPLELVADARERMLATADRLDREGDYLVLFQTVSARLELGAGVSVPDSVPADAEIVDYDGLERDIKSRLDGERITCGSFVGVWSPSS